MSNSEPPPPHFPSSLKSFEFEEESCSPALNNNTNIGITKYNNNLMALAFTGCLLSGLQDEGTKARH